MTSETKTIEDLGYGVDFVGENWCVIRPDGSYAVAIDSDVSASDDLVSAFGGLEPEWNRDLPGTNGGQHYGRLPARYSAG